jgi:hypothetical protein
MCRGCRKVVKSGWQGVSPWIGPFHNCETELSTDALPANRTWPPSCSHGTYQHKAITSPSRQLLMMGTWLPETCWTTIRREIKNTKSDICWFLLSTLKLCFFIWSTPHGVTLNHLSKLPATHDSLFCECLLSGNKFRHQVHVIITSLNKYMNAYTNQVPRGGRSPPLH